MNQFRATDSPWFWMAAFAFMGLVWLTAFGPKYARRQEMIERRYEARLEIARRHAAGEHRAEPAAPPARADEPAPDGEPAAEEAASRGDQAEPVPRELRVALEPLVFVLASVLELAVWRLLATGGAGEAAAPASPAPSKHEPPAAHAV